MNLKYMEMAFNEAKKAFKRDEIPVGAVVVKDDKVIAKAYNSKEKNKCSINHAEILSIIKASKKINNWRLDDCDIYITLDPCPMCASAIKQSRIKNVYSALPNGDKNNMKIISEIFNTDNVNPSVNFISNLSIEKGEVLLRDFFINKRKK